MTKHSGISEIIPDMDICDFEFDPCGYSMNGIHGPVLSTVHVTPEDGFSYASYEAMGLEPVTVSHGDLIEKVLRCFEPEDFSVAITRFCRLGRASSWGQKVAADGYNSNVLAEQDLPGDGKIMYQSFSASTQMVESPRSVMHFWDRDVTEKT